jgi:hypothetical protein
VRAAVFQEDVRIVADVGHECVPQARADLVGHDRSRREARSLFEHQHPQAGGGEPPGGDTAAGAAAHHDGIPVLARSGRHDAGIRARALDVEAIRRRRRGALGER